MLEKGFIKWINSIIKHYCRYFVLDVSRNLNSPNSSSDDSPGSIMKTIGIKYKEIDSTMLLSGQSPLMKARIDKIESVHSLDI